VLTSRSAIQLLEESPLLKIEDILPYFPPFTSLDSIKNEICSALEAYSVRIDELRQDMQDATDSADQIKEDIKKLETRFVTVDRDEACSRCGKLLLVRQFYVFPCQHVFHADCLIALVSAADVGMERRSQGCRQRNTCPPRHSGGSSTCKTKSSGYRNP
jgi:hypothetical protein